MKSVYISGPYTSDLGDAGEDQNILEAAGTAYRYMVSGWAVFCPHTMTCMIDREFSRKNGHTLNWEDWLTADLHWVSKCDAIHMLPGWKNSKGAVLEYMAAKALGLEILGCVSE